MSRKKTTTVTTSTDTEKTDPLSKVPKVSAQIAKVIASELQDNEAVLEYAPSIKMTPSRKVFTELRDVLIPFIDKHAKATPKRRADLIT